MPVEETDIIAEYQLQFKNALRKYEKLNKNILNDNEVIERKQELEQQIEDLYFYTLKKNEDHSLQFCTAIMED